MTGDGCPRDIGELHIRGSMRVEGTKEARMAYGLGEGKSVLDFELPLLVFQVRYNNRLESPPHLRFFEGGRKYVLRNVGDLPWVGHRRRGLPGDVYDWSMRAGVFMDIRPR